MTRRNKFVKPKLQVKFGFVFLGVASTAVLVQAIIIHSAMSDAAKRLPADGDILVSLLPQLLMSSIFLTLALIAPVVVGVGAAAMFRIAGPAHRMEVHMQAVARGENPGACKIRQRDELQGMCEAMNAAHEQLRGKVEVDDEVETGSGSTPEGLSQVA
ncbi:MAG: hypothetical protein GY711_18105 [bacterium]|nr:hypothetical protein [bacterium]